MGRLEVLRVGGSRELNCSDYISVAFAALYLEHDQPIPRVHLRLHLHVYHPAVEHGWKGGGCRAVSGVL